MHTVSKVYRFYSQSAKLVKYFGFSGEVDVEKLVKELLKEIQILPWSSIEVVNEIQLRVILLHLFEILPYH